MPACVPVPTCLCLLACAYLPVPAGLCPPARAHVRVPAGRRGLWRDLISLLPSLFGTSRPPVSDTVTVSTAAMAKKPKGSDDVASGANRDRFSGRRFWYYPDLPQGGRFRFVVAEGRREDAITLLNEIVKRHGKNGKPWQGMNSKNSTETTGTNTPRPAQRDRKPPRPLVRTAHRNGQRRRKAPWPTGKCHC